MNLLDRLFLLLTGLVAMYLIWRFWDHYQATGKRFDLSYIVAFAVLLVAGLLLIVFTYDVLSSPWVVIVAVLIPAGLAAGLVGQVYPRYELPYLILMLAGLLAVAVTRFTGPPALATITLIIVHSIAGLTIFFLPISAVVRDLTVAGFLWVTVGGALIGLGGLALAFLKTGGQLLFFSSDFVFTILAPLLFLMSLAFTWGFVKQMLASS
jgi:hypothetical protein